VECNSSDGEVDAYVPLAVAVMWVVIAQQRVAWGAAPACACTPLLRALACSGDEGGGRGGVGDGRGFLGVEKRRLLWKAGDESLCVCLLHAAAAVVRKNGEWVMEQRQPHICRNTPWALTLSHLRICYHIAVHIFNKLRL